MAKLLSLAALVGAVSVCLSPPSTAPLSIVTVAEAFTKDYPKQAPRPAVLDPSVNKVPGVYTNEEYEAAMPDWTDSEIDGPQLECTACLTVADAVARRFSKLKREFRVNMENIKPYHVDAALDDLCVQEQHYIGLLHPNVTNAYGARVDKQFRSDRMEKEDEILKAAKKKFEAKNKNSKTKKAEDEKKQAKASDKGKTPQEIKYEEEEAEWRRIGLSEHAIARRKRLRLPFTIWPEYADDREIREKLKGGTPQDVTVLRNTKIQSAWQNYCGEAVNRMEDFGVVKVFRGSKSFNLCPMCKRDDPLAQGRQTNPSGVSSNPEDAAAVSDAELKKKKAKEQQKKVLAEKIKSKRVDAGDDDDDEKFIQGNSDDEYEL